MMETNILDILISTNPAFWGYLILALFISIALLIILAIRFQIIFKQIDEEISLLHSFYASCIAQFSTYLLPFKVGAVAAKPLALKVLTKSPLKKSLFATFFEQFVDASWQLSLLPILLFIIGGEKLLDNSKIELAIYILLIILILWALKSYSRFISLAWKFKRFLPKSLLRVGKKMELTERDANEFMNKSIGYLSEWFFFIKLSIPTLFVIFVSPVIVQLTTLAFSLMIDFKTAFLIYWVSLVVGRLSGIPGGFGSRDITMVGLLGIFNIDVASAIKITFLYRFVTMLPTILIGGSLFLYLGKKIAFKL